jgi:hypothetical protein
MPLATPADVEARWRPLSDEESMVAETLIQDVSDQLRLRLPDVDDRISGGDLTASSVAGVVVAPVIRFLRNPNGYDSERIGDYSYTRSANGGDLLLTADDLARISVGPQGAFTIRPARQTHMPPQDLWL